MTENKNRNNRNRRANSSRKPVARHERLFARIVSGEGQITFTDITSHLGKPCPFAKPQAFMAMRASDDICTFHLLHLSKKKSKSFGSSNTTMPDGGLKRLERRAGTYNLGADDVVIELSTYVDTDPNAGMDALDIVQSLAAPTSEASPDLEDLFAEEAPGSDLEDLFAEETSTAGAEVPAERPQRTSKVTAWNFKLNRTSTGLGSLVPVGEEHSIDLETRPVRASVYMLSPLTQKPVAISFIGFLGKAGSEETMGRVGAKILASALHLPAFQAVTALSGMEIDAADGFDASAALQASLGKAEFFVKSFLFNSSADQQPAGSGYVGVSVRLDYANQTAGKVLFELTPDETIADSFTEGFSKIVTEALGILLRSRIGDAGMHQIISDIVHGGVTSSTVEQLVEAGKSINALDIAGDGNWREHN